MKIFAFHLLIAILLWLNPAQCLYFATNCPSSYTCDITQGIFTIRCKAPCSTSVGGQSLVLPIKSQTSELVFTLSIIGKNNFLQALPTNLCTYGIDLRILDLSSNAISSALTSSYLGCMTALETVDFSNNFISTIEENAFDSLNSLISLDLSYNGLKTLPSNLFVLKVPNLQSLKLQNNMLTEIDVWFFFLKSINYIDLSRNQITQFVNRIGWTPRSTSTLTQLLSSQSTIDLSYNRFTKFDDDILNSYRICNSGDLSYFLKLMYTAVLTNNNISCTCDSYNMLLWYQTLITNNAITTVENLFQTKCATPSQYTGKSIFNFVNSDECVGVSKYPPIVYETCVTAQVNISGPDLLVNPPDQLTNLEDQPVITALTPAQIGGVVVGFLFLFFLFVCLLYCLCPIEILACAFDACKWFYTVCPCKSTAFTDKYYDIFVSYNKSSEKWVKKELVPFFKEEKAGIRYYLQHASDNPERNGAFGDFTKDKMNNSAIILLILSDKYLIDEWTMPGFQDHLRRMLTRPNVQKISKQKLLAIQLSDVSDEEVDDYIRARLQIPTFVSMETDEILFWKKLEYFLYLNRETDIMPIDYPPPFESPIESPRMMEESKGIINEQFLLDEYTTSLEQIVYEKQPDDVFKNIKYDHLNKKFKIKIGGNHEDQSLQEFNEKERSHRSSKKSSSHHLKKQHHSHKTSKHEAVHSEDVDSDPNLNQKIINESLKYYRSMNRTPRDEEVAESGRISVSKSRSKSKSGHDPILKCSNPNNMVLF